MLKNFEQHTDDLTPEELRLIPMLLAGFAGHPKSDPIKAPKIVEQMKAYLKDKGSKTSFTEARLRKCVNYIRTHSLLPLIATSNGYYTSHDPAEIESQVQSLQERARSIQRCADGLKKFLR